MGRVFDPVVRGRAMPRPLMTIIGAFLLAMAVGGSFAADGVPQYTKPKVRAITGFVRLDRASYERQVADTLLVLKAARASSKSAVIRSRLCGS